MHHFLQLRLTPCKASKRIKHDSMTLRRKLKYPYVADKLKEHTFCLSLSLKLLTVAVSPKMCVMMWTPCL